MAGKRHYRGGDKHRRTEEKTPQRTQTTRKKPRIRGLKKALEKEKLEVENLNFEGQTQGNHNFSKGEG